MSNRNGRPTLEPSLRFAARRVPMLPIIAAAIALVAIVAVVIMLGMLQPDDFVVVRRLFTAVQ
jgi:hypothetical protein